MTIQTKSSSQNQFTPDRLNRRARTHELLDTRWSPRSFSETAVPDWKIVELMEAARWAPSSANEQPWRFIVTTKDDAAIYEALLGTLSEGNRRWANRAPVLILGVAASLYSKTGHTNRHAWYDLGQSIANLTFQASALGLVVHQMGGFDGERARLQLSIPPDFEPVVVLAVGNLASPEELPADLQSREMAPRSRKPMEEIVFTNLWGKPSQHIINQNPLLNNLPSSN